MNENVIEWLTGDGTVTLSLSQRKYINKIYKLKEKNPDEVRIVTENKDGSIVVKLPLKYIKISGPRQMTEEQRNQARERFKKYRRY
jgi:hypothetical protein